MGVLLGGCAAKIHPPSPVTLEDWADADFDSEDIREIREYCTRLPRERTDISQLICYDYTSRDPLRVSEGTANDNIIIQPNLQLVVRVIRRTADADQERLEIALGGNPGETKIRVEGDPLVAASPSFSAPGSRTYKGTTFTVYEARFVPRTTGFVPLSLITKKTAVSKLEVTEQTETVVKNPVRVLVKETLNAKGDLSEKVLTTEPQSETVTAVKKSTEKSSVESSTKSFEFLVPNYYAGAIRLGISALLGLNEHSYSRRQAPGVDAFEVVDHGASFGTAELVVGYAPYPQAFTRQRGREYVRYYKPTAFRRRIAPYFGLGLTSVTTNGDGTRVRWLRSFYLGLEYEPFQSVSIAFAVTASRTDTLAAGLMVGGPIGKDTSLTDSEFRPGLGIVVNFTPEFLKFAVSLK